MHYKNKSQHRAAGYFQRLAEVNEALMRARIDKSTNEVTRSTSEILTPVLFLAQCRRLVTRIKELDISGLTDELVRKFYSGKRYGSTINRP